MKILQEAVFCCENGAASASETCTRQCGRSWNTPNPPTRERIARCNLDPETEYLRNRERPACDACGQRLAFEQFQYEVFGVVLSADVVQVAGVRVIEGRDRLGLALEAGGT